MFFLNNEIESEFNSLPENVRNSISSKSGEIKSSEELNELVRRIKDAETGKLN